MTESKGRHKGGKAISNKKSSVKDGRPSKKDTALVALIGQRLGTGEPLTHICKSLNICDDTVRNWMKEDAEVFRVIARAREDGEEAIAYNLRQVARGLGESTLDVQRDKLIIDTDLKLLAKWNPKKYGDKITQEHTGADGGAIKTETVTKLDYSKLSKVQLETLLAIESSQVK